VLAGYSRNFIGRAWQVKNPCAGLSSFARAICYRCDTSCSVYIWILTIGFLLGAPNKAFVAMAWLQVATAIVRA
jgi:hypothetical protein